MIPVGIILRYLHGFQLLEPCLFGYLVVAIVGIMLEVPHIGNVSHVSNLVAQMLEVSEHDIEGDGRSGMTKMRVAINGWSTNVHAHVWCVQWFKQLLLSCQRIIYQQVLFHISNLYG